MKIGYFSDSHGHHKELKIPECDVLIFGGDLMTNGYSEYELDDFLKWFDKQDAKYRILVAGNHDRWIENNRPLFLDKLDNYSIIYLENSGVIIEGIYIYGIPDSHFFYNWAFNRSQEQLQKCADGIPIDTNILITHAPAYKILDMCPDGVNAGEPQWNKKIKELKNLKYHLSGHIHDGYGINKQENYIAINGSVLNEQYKLVNPITIFEYDR